MVPSQVSLYVACSNAKTLKTKLASFEIGEVYNNLSENSDYRAFHDQLINLFNDMVRPTGLSTDEILDVPNGQLAYILMPFADKVGQCVMVEAKEELPAMELLLHHLGNALSSRGFRTNKTYEKEIELIVWSSKDKDGNDICGMCYFLLDGFAVIADHIDLLREVATRWSGRSSVGRLSDDPEFQKEKRKSYGVTDIEIFARPTKFLNKENLYRLRPFDSYKLLPLIANRCSVLYADLRLDNAVKLTVGLHVDDPRNFVKRQGGDAILLMSNSNPYATTDAVAVSYMDFDYWTFEQLIKSDAVPKETKAKTKAIRDDNVAKMQALADKNPKVLERNPELKDRLTNWEKDWEDRDKNGNNQLYSENSQPQVIMSRYPNHEFVTAYRLKDAELAKRSLIAGLLKSYSDKGNALRATRIGNDFLYSDPTPEDPSLSDFIEETRVIGIQGDHLLFASSQKFWEGVISTDSITELPSFSLVKQELSKMAGTRKAIAAQYFDYGRMLEGVSKGLLYRLFVSVFNSMGGKKPDAFLTSLAKNLGVGGSIVTLEENVFRYEVLMFSRD